MNIRPEPLDLTALQESFVLVTALFSVLIQQLVVDCQVVIHHAVYRKARFNMVPANTPINLGDFGYRFDQLLYRISDEAGLIIDQDFRDGTVSNRKNRCAAG